MYVLCMCVIFCRDYERNEYNNEIKNAGIIERKKKKCTAHAHQRNKSNMNKTTKKKNAKSKKHKNERK